MTSMFNRLKQALINSSSKISSGIEQIFLKKKLDEETLNSLEELLITSDISTKVAKELISSLKQIKFDKEVSAEVIKRELANLISQYFAKTIDKPFALIPNALTVVLVCGVNGNGKTTTIGKLAASYAKQNKAVAIAACDTFRAAAVEQLATWAKRSGALLIKGEIEADPASVAYNAIKQAKENNIDLLFIDTAGRLHNYKNLMDELGKIIKVIKKIDETAPHYSMLVLDATTGQNAQNQIEHFTAVAGINSLVLTKLDGTARAGTIVGIVQKYNIPVHFIGIGEQLEDLKPFEVKAFAEALVGAS